MAYLFWVKKKGKSNFFSRMVHNNLKIIFSDTAKGIIKGLTNNFNLLQHQKINIIIKIHKSLNNELTIQRLEASHIP